MRTRTLHILTTVLLVTTLVVACGGDDDATDGVASIETPTDDAARGGGRQGMESAVLEFTSCLRGEGVEVPDIQLDSDGAPLIRPDDVAALDLESDEFQEAFDGCLPILTDAGAFSFDSDPELEALLSDQLQAFAECMRREGVTDFPDPTPSAATPFPLSAFLEFAGEDFQDALSTCRSEISVEGLNG